MSRITFHMDQGPRENLEDTCAALKVGNPLAGGQEAILAIVLDGVGGANYGEVASAHARRQLAAALSGLASILVSQEGEALIPPNEIPGVLCDTMSQSNEALLQQIAEHPHLEGMATTAVCAFIVGGALYAAWVGDSRCYLYSGGKLRRITQDHSQVAELVELGVITLEEAGEHPDAHTITRYLGQAAGFQADTRTCRVAPGDIVILCTDGLTDVVSDEEIATHVEACRAGLLDLDELPRVLVKQALRAGTQDNATVLCCEYQPVGERADTQVNQTLTEAYSVELARSMRQLTQEVSHA